MCDRLYRFIFILIIIVGALQPACAVLDPPVVIIGFDCIPSQIAEGGKATLIWSVTGAQTVAIDPNIGPVNAEGSKTISPKDNTTYTITAINASHTQTIKNYALIQVVKPTKSTSAQPSHNISQIQIDTTPAYWNLSWQNSFPAMLQKAIDINKQYFKTHTYIANQTDCNDMAIDIWNQLGTAGIVSIIVAGNLSLPNYTFDQCNHAWLLILTLPKGQTKPAAIALECTNSQVYGINQTAKPYWTGFFYSNPANLRADLKDRW